MKNEKKEKMKKKKREKQLIAKSFEYKLFLKYTK